MNTVDTRFVVVMECMARSPFVQKVGGLAKDAETAPRIRASEAKAETVKRAHEQALAMLQKAAQDPDLYLKALTGHLRAVAGAAQREMEDAQSALNALPKADESFVENCRREKARLLAHQEKKRQDVQRQRDAEAAVERSRLRFRTLLCLLAAAAGAVLFALKRGQALGIAGLILLVAGLAAAAAVLSAGRRRRSEEAAPAELEGDRELEKLEEKIRRGYEENSDFARRRSQAEAKVAQAREKRAQRLQELKAYQAISGRGFQDGILLLKKTLENFTALSAWAAEQK